MQFTKLVILATALLPSVVFSVAARPGFSVHARREGSMNANGVHINNNNSIDIDVHIPVSGVAFAAVLTANTFLNYRLNNSEVDFSTVDTPHVTLYLTSFSCPRLNQSVPECIRTVATAINGTVHELGPPLGPCNISLTNTFAAGTYAMINVTVDTCLQKYSDAIVFATYQLSQPNQTAPDWVKSLPEPERSEKLSLIKEFGSPNVFSQFQPHVTVAWANDTTHVAEAVAELGNVSTSFLANELAMGSVGNHGTVLQHKDMATFRIN